MSSEQEVNRRAAELERAQIALAAATDKTKAAAIGRLIDATIKFDKAWDAAVKDGGK